MDIIKEARRITSSSLEAIAGASNNLDLILNGRTIQNIKEHSADPDEMKIISDLEHILVIAEDLITSIGGVMEERDGNQYCQTCSGTGISNMSGNRPDDFGPHVKCGSCDGNG